MHADAYTEISGHIYVYMRELLNSRYESRLDTEYKGCKSTGKPEKRHPAIQKSLHCTFNLADIQSDSLFSTCNISGDETL